MQNDFVSSKILPHLKPIFSGRFLLHPLRSLTCQRWLCQMTRHQKVPRQLVPATWTSLVPWRRKVDVPSDRRRKNDLLWKRWSHDVSFFCDSCDSCDRGLFVFTLIQFWHWWDVELFYCHCFRCARYYFPNSQRLGPDSHKTVIDCLIVSRHVKSPLWLVLPGPSIRHSFWGCARNS